MIPPNAIQTVQALHQTYVARTGYDIAYNIARENTWREWCTWGGWAWTPEDLARVIGYLRKKIRKGERNEGALKFMNLIGRPDNFEEDLQLAREEARQTFGSPRRSASTASKATAPESEDSAPLDPAEAARLWREQMRQE